MIKFLKRLWYGIECHECGKGRINHIGTDWTGRVWIEVYSCNHCGNEYILAVCTFLRKGSPTTDKYLNILRNGDRSKVFRQLGRRH